MEVLLEKSSFLLHCVVRAADPQVKGFSEPDLQIKEALFTLTASKFFLACKSLNRKNPQFLLHNSQFICLILLPEPSLTARFCIKKGAEAIGLTPQTGLNMYSPCLWPLCTMLWKYTLINVFSATLSPFEQNQLNE